MKILAADDLDALLSVVGVHTHGAQPLNVEFAGSRRVDLLSRTDEGIIHVEFVKDPTSDMAARMVEYWGRIRIHLLRHPTSAPLAILAGGDDRQRGQALASAADLISQVDPDRSRSLLDAATNLAAIVLPARESRHPSETHRSTDVYDRVLRSAVSRDVDAAARRRLR